MAPRSGVGALRKRFVFADCRRKPLLYRGIARVAGFGADRIQGRMVVNIEIYPDKRAGRARKRSASKRSRTGRTRGR